MQNFEDFFIHLIEDERFYEKFSPRRKLVELCREEFGYSESTLSGDILGSCYEDEDLLSIDIK